MKEELRGQTFVTDERHRTARKQYISPLRGGRHNDKVTEWTRKIDLFLPLTSKCDLDLKATDLDLPRDTSSHSGQHFCQVIFKSPEE